LRGYPLRRSTFDFEAKEIKLKQLNKLMSETDFWSNNVKAQSISKEASSYEKILNLLFTLESELNDLKELLNLSKQEEDVLRDINKQVKNFEKKT
jgi:protein subunit release factor A